MPGGWKEILILTFGNLVINMNRIGISSVLEDMERAMDVSSADIGLMQTLFTAVMLCFGPVFGYFGDRMIRKILIILGTFIWTISSLLGSIFERDFIPFACFRVLAGLGDACYNTAMPSLIGDFYVGVKRSKMLAVFYLAGPFGCGLGYVVCAEIAIVSGQWIWAIRVVPLCGLVMFFLIMFINEPVRGALEGQLLKRSELINDVKHLLRNKSFLSVTAGYTFACFVGGAFGYWGPTMFSIGTKLQQEIYDPGQSSLALFGLTVVSGGMTGISMGYFLSSIFNRKYPKTDSLICTVSMLASSPFLCGIVYSAPYSTSLLYVITYIGISCVYCHPALVADITFSVVVPGRRAISQGIQLFVGHALGDAISPYLFGKSVYYFETYFFVDESHKYNTKYDAMVYSVLVLCSFVIFSSLAFYVNSFYIIEDRQRKEVAASLTQIVRAPPSTVI